MENELKILRKEIDEIDSKLMELFVLRMQIAEKIAKIKYDNNIKITNKEREKEIKSKIENHPTHIVKNYYEPVNNALIKASKKYQEDLIKTNFR